MIKRIHHVNFIVRNLNEAAERFEQLLGMPAGKIESLPHRGVDLVRFKLGETWLVLVHPVNSESIPGQFLSQHGEGFFLLSCEVEDLESSARQLSAKGFHMLQDNARPGLNGWRVMDLDPEELFGIHFQLVET